MRARCLRSRLELGRRLAVLTAALLAATHGRATHAACQVSRYAELPVTIQQSRPLIAGTLNGLEGQLIADSGAFFSILSRETAQRLKLRLDPLPPSMQVRGTSGAADVSVATVKELTLQGFGTARNVQFLVGGNAFTAGLLGVLGQNVIGQADTEFDLADGVIRLFHTKDCAQAMLAYWHGDASVAIMPIREMSPEQPQILAQATINGGRITVLLDTGASRSMLAFRAARRAGIRLDGPEVQPGGTWEGLNGRSFETWITHFDSLDVGGEQIKNARLRIADIEMPSGADLLLGMDFFLSHRIFVSASQHRVFITYNGGRVFDLSPTAGGQESASSTPTDAAGFRRRAAAFAARKQLADAIADLGRAIELEPDDAGSYHQRGLLHWESGDPAAAIMDFDEALKRSPDSIAVLMDRGTVRLAGRQQEQARADFDRIAVLAPKDPTVSLQIADAYEGAGYLSEALFRLDRWVAENPRDDRVPGALAERCWARSRLGTDLERALSDCDGALRGGQRNARNLDARAMVWLRMGKYDKAIADYRASLELQPKEAESRYGLGLAEFRSGQRAAGEADMKAALESRATIGDEFKRQGF
jgi:tetratricopeptide (TPR) repeat protein/predicted aspartyl protease